MSDLYALLGVSRDASADEVKRAYRSKAREHHPDAGGDAEMFKQVTHAHQVLSDPQRRARYDRFGDDGTNGSAAGGDPFGFGGIGDVIDAFFGTSFTGGSSRRPASGRDVLVGVEVDLEDVATGIEREVEVEIATACQRCEGSGSASGASAGRCAACGGAGQVRRVVRTAFGQVASAAPCPSCSGSGRAVGDPCESCAGDGRVVERRTLTVPVPAGVDNGDRLRITGAGEAGRQGASPGDLFVEVRVNPHAVFERDGRDLFAEVVIPMTQAILGGSITVPGIDGDDLTATVPAGVQPGDVLKVRRAGLPMKGGGRRGDLQLVVRVEVPTSLDDDQRGLVQQLAELRGDATASSGRGLFTRLRSGV
ncbi:MAG: molecular chaperone DnaJ [Nitriliruptoraceae bacterium]